MRASFLRCSRSSRNRSLEGDSGLGWTSRRCSGLAPSEKGTSVPSWSQSMSRSRGVNEGGGSSARENVAGARMHGTSKAQDRAR
jgi:hypothetical protein